MRTIASLVLCVVTLAAAQPPSRLLRLETASSRRLGLLIGNAKYLRASTLANPVNDVKSVGQVLREVGFEIELATDSDLKTMRRAIDRFVERLHPGDVGL